MKWIGGLTMFAAVSAVAQFADLKPKPGRACARGALSAATGGVFLTGLMLFARGLRREIVEEVRPDRPT